MGKAKKYVDQQARSVLAENLRREMERVFHDSGDKARALAAATRKFSAQPVSKTTVQRLIGAAVKDDKRVKEISAGASIDTIALLARCLEISMFELLLSKDEAGSIERANKILAVADATSDRPPQRGGSIGRGSSRTGTY